MRWTGRLCAYVRFHTHRMSHVGDRVFQQHAVMANLFIAVVPEPSHSSMPLPVVNAQSSQLWMANMTLHGGDRDVPFLGLFFECRFGFSSYRERATHCPPVPHIQLSG